MAISFSAKWTLIKSTYPATKRCGDVVTTSLCTSQRGSRYVSNETPNNVSVEHRRDVSVVRLYGFLLVCRDDTSRGRNDDVPSVRLHDVSNKSQMKHPTTSQWYLTKTSQWYVSTTSPLVCLCDVSCNSQMKHPIKSLRYVSITSQSYVVATPCLYYGLYFVFKLLCHDLQLVDFHVSFKHHIKHHIFLVPTWRVKRGVVWIIN